MPTTVHGSIYEAKGANRNGNFIMNGEAVKMANHIGVVDERAILIRR